MSKPLTETLERTATHPATREASEAEACGSMEEVRAEIDRIDREIVALLAERAGYVQQAARVKRLRGEIVDPARIEEIVAKTRAAAAERGLPPDLVEPLFRLMIERFIALETELFDRLQDQPE